MVAIFLGRKYRGSRNSQKSPCRGVVFMSADPVLKSCCLGNYLHPVPSTFLSGAEGAAERWIGQVLGLPEGVCMKLGVYALLLGASGPVSNSVS